MKLCRQKPERGWTGFTGAISGRLLAGARGPFPGPNVAVMAVPRRTSSTAGASSWRQMAASKALQAGFAPAPVTGFCACRGPGGGRSCVPTLARRRKQRPWSRARPGAARAASMRRWCRPTMMVRPPLGGGATVPQRAKFHRCGVEIEHGGRAGPPVVLGRAGVGGGLSSGAGDRAGTQVDIELGLGEPAGVGAIGGTLATSRWPWPSTASRTSPSGSRAMSR